MLTNKLFLNFPFKNKGREKNTPENKGSTFVLQLLLIAKESLKKLIPLESGKSKLFFLMVIKAVNG